MRTKCHSDPFSLQSKKSPRCLITCSGPEGEYGSSTEFPPAAYVIWVFHSEQRQCDACKIVNSKAKPKAEEGHLEEAMVPAFDLMDHQTRKKELAAIGKKLSGLAHDLHKICKTQPDYSERLDGIYRELKSISQRLRGIN